MATFCFSEAGEKKVRVPISYLMKLAMANAISGTVSRSAVVIVCCVDQTVNKSASWCSTCSMTDDNASDDQLTWLPEENWRKAWFW